MPKLGYLDHSLVTNDPAWPSLQRLFQDSRYQLCLSIWNLLEIGSASDLAQRKVRVAFLSSLKLVWLLDHVYVRKQEVKRYLWPRLFDTAAPEMLYVAPHLPKPRRAHVVRFEHILPVLTFAATVVRAKAGREWLRALEPAQRGAS